MRKILACLMIVGLLASVSSAGDAKAPPAMAEQIARIILGPDGPQQNFASQYLEQADQNTVRAVQAAIRKLAPEVAKRSRAGKGLGMKAPAPKDGRIDLVTVTARFLAVDVKDGFLNDIGVGLKGLDGKGLDGYDTSTLAYLDDTQLEIILRAVEKSTRIQQMTAPRLSVYNGQHANVSVMNKLDYVKRHELTCLDGATVVRPVPASVYEGLVLGLLPTLSKDKRYITLELEGTSAGVAKPIREETVEFLGTKYTQKSPRVSLHSWRSTVRIPSGGSVLIRNAGASGFAKKGAVEMLLVTASAHTMTADEMSEALEEINLKPKPAAKDARKAPAKK